MIVVAYLEIGLALPLALVFDALYLAKVLQPWDDATTSHHDFPPEQMYSHMVLCGPWGQSSFALQSLGRAVFQLKGEFGAGGVQQALLFSDRGADTVAFASMLAGLVGWGQGTFWWAFAIVSITKSVVARLRLRHSVAFHLPMWAMVFPWVSRWCRLV
jgi:tellurite resistance protein TehA-like permease